MVVLVNKEVLGVVPKGRTPISVTHPNLAQEAVGWDPSAFSYGSQVLLDWLCPEGHVYQATPNNRSHGTTCSFCSGRRVLPGFNDLATLDPDLAGQAVGGDPHGVTRWSHQSLIWRCRLDHEWVETVATRSGGSGCPYCSGQRVMPGFNDLATTHPAIAAQAVGWNATRVSKGSNTPVMWRCERGHHYEMAPNRRTSGRGCPYCSGNRVLAGFNDLATTRPDLAAQAFGWDARKVSAGSHRAPQWRCTEGHVWSAVVKSRVQGAGCPQCRQLGRLAIVRELHPGAPKSAASPAIASTGDLATLYPTIAEEAMLWSPEGVSVRSPAVRLWLCRQCLYEWEASVAQRVDGRTCPYCSGKRVVPGVNDLRTVAPDLAEQALGWDPSDVLATAWTKLEWVCEQGHNWTSPVGERRRGYGCPYCAGRKVWIGFNDLETTDPDVALEADGWSPTTVSRGHEKAKAWRCGSCGFRWTASPNNRTNMHSGCPRCAEHGYNATEPGYIYLLEQPHSGLLKVGITNVPDVRFAQHRRRQWVKRDLVGPMDGGEAQRLEQAILKAIRARGALKRFA